MGTPVPGGPPPDATSKVSSVNPEQVEGAPSPSPLPVLGSGMGERGVRGGAGLTQPHFAGVGEVVVAGDVAPLPPVVPHDDHAVLSGEKVAVGLPGVPVLVELKRGGTGRHRGLGQLFFGVTRGPIPLLPAPGPRHPGAAVPEASHDARRRRGFGSGFKARR